MLSGSVWPSEDEYETEESKGGEGKNRKAREARFRSLFL